MDSLTTTLLVGVIVLVLFFVLRVVMLWYWRIDAIVSRLDAILAELSAMRARGQLPMPPSDSTSVQTYPPAQAVPAAPIPSHDLAASPERDGQQR